LEVIMFRFFMQCGLIGWPLLIITIANIVMVVRCAITIPRLRSEDGPRVVNRINAILFWGALAAVLGFLGQYTGIYKALGAIIVATEISPNVVMQGLRESFTTVLWGLNLLVWSAVAWAALQAWYRKASSGWERTAPPV
jgi:biopolymer transport protein ExbB/TolQ